MIGRVRKSAEQWRRELTAEQYAVTREGATEQPFTGRYYHHHEPGDYRCVCCGTVVFKSEDKYDSGSGWPSFTQPANREHVITREDVSHGMRRVEVLCAACEAHLGHVFPDGPQPTGLRFCVNSVALDFEPEGEKGDKG